MMDLAYDHIVEQTYGERTKTPTPEKSSESTDPTNQGISAGPASPPRQNLQTEFQDTFRAFSNSAWGTKLGGFWGNVKKQGESYYEEAVKEVGDLGADALKEIEGLRNKVVNVSVSRPRSDTVRLNDGQEHTRVAVDEEPVTTLEENETFINRFKTEAAKRLKEVQKAEDAADDALLRFGTNLRNFLRDAVAVSAPEPSTSDPGASTEVMFESKDAVTGKRVAHASRFDAQLYVIHTSLSSFTQDPDEDGNQWEDFKTSFDIEHKTGDIARDLEKYKELRSMMETLVPTQIDYKDFWARYYFLRQVIEKQEEKRREMLKASTSADEEEVGWGDDESENEDNVPQVRKSSEETPKHFHTSTTASEKAVTPAVDASLKPADPRRSHDEKSVADSDASYDLVSGNASRAPGSPQGNKNKHEESEDEDWE